MVKQSVLGKFGSNTTFMDEIETLVHRHKLSYVDAIVHFCEKNNVELEYAASLILKDKVMKSKLQFEAENLNILQKSARLPI